MRAARRPGWSRVIGASCGALVLAATGLSQPAVAQTAPPQLRSLIEQAKGEQVLRLSWGEATLGGSTVARQLADGMNKAYGLNIEMNFTPIEAFARVAAQPRGDHQRYGGGCDHAAIGHEEGLERAERRQIFGLLAALGVALDVLNHLFGGTGHGLPIAQPVGGRDVQRSR